MVIIKDKRIRVKLFMPQNQRHIPVLLKEVLKAIEPVRGKIILDCTFGAGGYSKAFLESGARVIAIDKDKTVIPFAQKLQEKWGGNFSFYQMSFSQIKDLAQKFEKMPDAIVLDIGVSSMQLDEAERGFSFLREGRLDMRMGGEGIDAAYLVNNLSEDELSDIIFAYGEEKSAKKIAAAIVKARKEKQISTTIELANIIEKIIGKRGAIHPATRTFQALRIAVNNEFEELVTALFGAEQILDAGGQLLVVSFHSLEDRIIKRFFALGAQKTNISRHLPQIEQSEQNKPSWQNISKAIRPSQEEIKNNPRARSAKLRYGFRTNNKARELDFSGLGVPLSQKGRKGGKGRRYA